jgi:hypothetical protein
MPYLFHVALFLLAMAVDAFTAKRRQLRLITLFREVVVAVTLGKMLSLLVTSAIIQKLIEPLKKLVGNLEHFHANQPAQPGEFLELESQIRDGSHI